MKAHSVATRKGKRGWDAAGKVIVFGTIKRNGQVKAFPLHRRTRREVFELVCEHTLPGRLYYTDDWQAYARCVPNRRVAWYLHAIRMCDTIN